MMRANRLLWLLWIVVTTLYALRGFAIVGTGRDASEITVPMLTALVLMKLYEMDGDDR